MGYQTVCNVSRVSTYAQAKKMHDDTKPIRGRAVEKRPLGQRRDADNYWVRMDGENVEFMVYGTACITWRPDGTVLLYVGSWSSQTTHQFFEQVLGVTARGFDGRSLIVKSAIRLPKLQPTCVSTLLMPCCAASGATT